MNNLILISDKFIKKYAPIILNTDDNLFAKCIQDIQRIQLKDVLGNYYDTFMDDVYKYVTAQIPMSDVTNGILESVKFYVMYFSMKEYFVLNQAKITNKGALKSIDINGQTISNEEFVGIRSLIDNKASIYHNQLLELIIKYNIVSKSYNDKGTNNASGIYLPRRKKNGCSNGSTSTNPEPPYVQVFDGELKIETDESLKGGGKFTANQKDNTTITLGLEDSLLEKIAEAVTNEELNELISDYYNKEEIDNIIANLPSTDTNIYNSNGQLNDNRVIDANNHYINWNKITGFNILSGDSDNGGGIESRNIQMYFNQNNSNIYLYGGYSNDNYSYTNINNGRLYIYNYDNTDGFNSSNINMGKYGLDMFITYNNINTNYNVGNYGINLNCYDSDINEGSTISLAPTGVQFVSNIFNFAQPYTGNKVELKPLYLTNIRTQYLPDGDGTLVTTINSQPADDQGNIDVFARFPQVTYTQKMAMTGMQNGDFVYQTDEGKGLYYWNATQGYWAFQKPKTKYIDGRSITSMTLTQSLIGQDMLFIIPDFPVVFNVDFNIKYGGMPNYEEVMITKYGWGKLTPIVDAGVQIVCSNGASYIDIFNGIYGLFSITYVAVDYVFLRVYHQS